MALPTLSVIIPTHDGVDLDRVLASAEQQGLRPGDEVIVVGDTHDGPLPVVESETTALGKHYRYLAFNAGRHAWGHPQRNYAIKHASGAYLVFIDDDDIFLPSAFKSIRTAIAERSEPRPLMFRFVLTPRRQVLWQTPELVEGSIGGHQFVVPNVPERLGEWTDRYNGDYDFITSTLVRWPSDSLEWRPEIISVARPLVTARVVSTVEDVQLLRRLRNEGRMWMRDTRAISPQTQATWWANRDPTRIRPYLFQDSRRQTIGFGMLRKDDEHREWVTLCVTAERRRQGYGTEIYRWLLHAAAGVLYAESRADNLPSLRAAQQAGFVVMNRSDDTLLLRGRREGP